MSNGFEEAGIQHKFTESISNSYFAKFKSKEEIIREYKKRGYQKINLHNAVDSDGNILAYTFNVFCYKSDSTPIGDGATGFVRYDQFLKDKD